MYPLDSTDFTGYGPRLRFRDVTRAYPVVTVAPTQLPVDMAQVKLAARISGTIEDSLIEDYVNAAVEDVQYDAEIALMTQTRTLSLDYFPAWEIELRCPPIGSVTSVSYLDYTGSTQTLASTAYRVDAVSRPGIITPAYGTVWPVAYPVLSKPKPAHTRNKYVSVEQLKATAVSDAGGHLNEAVDANWEVMTDQWADVVPRGAREFFRGKQVAEDITHQVEMLLNEESDKITTKMRMRFDGRTLKIAEPPQNVEEENHSLVFACTEVK